MCKGVATFCNGCVDNVDGVAKVVMTLLAQPATVCTFLLTVPKVPRNSAFVGRRPIAVEFAAKASSAPFSLLCGVEVALLLVLVSPLAVSLAVER